VKRAWLRYGAASAVGLSFFLALALAAGTESRRDAVLLALMVAVPVQIIAFGLLLRFREKPAGFLAAWLGGTFLRMGALGWVAYRVVREDLPEPAWTLIGLVGVFFVLHLLEPWALRDSKENSVTADGHG
jgi:hypothetical protein